MKEKLGFRMTGSLQNMICNTFRGLLSINIFVSHCNEKQFHYYYHTGTIEFFACCGG